MKNRRPLLGILAFLPLVMTCIFLVLYMQAFFGMMGNLSIRNGQPADPSVMMQYMSRIMHLVLYFVVPALMVYIGLLVVFIRDLLSRPGVGDGERAVWIAVMVLFSGVGFPVYYFMYVYPDKGRQIPGGAIGMAA